MAEEVKDVEAIRTDHSAKTPERLDLNAHSAQPEDSFDLSLSVKILSSQYRRSMSFVTMLSSSSSCKKPTGFEQKDFGGDYRKQTQRWKTKRLSLGRDLRL